MTVQNLRLLVQGYLPRQRRSAHFPLTPKHLAKLPLAEPVQHFNTMSTYVQGSTQPSPFSVSFVPRQNTCNTSSGPNETEGETGCCRSGKKPVYRKSMPKPCPYVDVDEAIIIEGVLEGEAYDHMDSSARWRSFTTRWMRNQASPRKGTSIV